MSVGAIVTGAAGRMGGRIVGMVREGDGIRLVGAVERPANANIGLDVGLSLGLGALEVRLEDDLGRSIDAASGEAKVVIDFTNAEASAVHAKTCAEHGVALVVGSTGFNEEATARVEAAAKKIPVVMAPNMSVSVNLLFMLARTAAQILGDEYDVEIVEMHHRKKVDAPSGTALRLGEVIGKALGRSFRDVAQHGRHGAVGERTRSEIGVHALRGSDVVGEHTVYFFGDGDRIELTHRATSRDTFARGAVRAALWAAEQKPGLYGMPDVLGFGS